MKSNQISSKILVCLLAICATCGLSCRRKTPPAKPSPEPKETKVEVDVNLVEPAAVPDTGPNSIAVTINGTNITEGQVDAMIEPQLAAMAKQAQNRPPEFMEQMRKMFRQQAMERTVIDQLIDEKAKQANITISEQDVDKQIEKVASMQRPPVSVEDFKKKMEGIGLGFDEIKQQVRRGLVFQKILEVQFPDEMNITEDDAKKHYLQFPDQFKKPERVKASHILIKLDTSDPNTDPNQANTIAKAKAEELLKEINEGADFAELAKANSDCPSAARGGDLGSFGKGKMVQPFETAAFQLDAGQVSDVVKTKSGYHIIKVADHQQASVTPFEEAKDKIITQLTQRKQRELATKYIDSLKASADIVYPAGKEPEPLMPPSRRMPPPRQPEPAETKDETATEEQ